MPEEKDKQRSKKVAKKRLKRQGSKKVEQESSETAKTGKSKRSKKVKSVKEIEEECNSKRLKTQEASEPVEKSKEDAEEGSMEVGKKKRCKTAKGNTPTEVAETPGKKRGKRAKGTTPTEVAEIPDKKRGKTAKGTKSTEVAETLDKKRGKTKKSSRVKKADMSPTKTCRGKMSPQKKRKDPELAAKASRKSSAYHCAKRKAKKEGLSEEECERLAKEACIPCLYSQSFFRKNAQDFKSEKFFVHRRLGHPMFQD